MVTKEIFMVTAQSEFDRQSEFMKSPEEEADKDTKH